jgi:hypothetical protein
MALAPFDIDGILIAAPTAKQPPLVLESRLKSAIIGLVMPRSYVASRVVSHSSIMATTSAACRATPAGAQQSTDDDVTPSRRMLVAARKTHVVRFVPD